MGPQQTSAPARLRGLYQLTRLHKFPLGSLIIYWPYGWSLAMAASSGHGSLDTLWKNVLILFIAATLYHSAFCVWNDICDRDLDVKVERTRNRPLVTGVVPVSDAYGMFIGLLILTFLAVSLTNRTAFAIMTTSLPINIIYPLAKRWTWWPQLLLGVACSWGCIVGWAAMAGSKLGLLETPALRALCVADTLFMVFADTMYAAQDKSDDDKAGIRSTARLFGAHIRTINALFALGFVSALAFAGRLNGNGIPYFLGCAGAALHAAWQLLMWRPDDAESSAAMFEQCHNLGYVVFLGIIVDIWI